MFERVLRLPAGALIRHWPFANGSGRLIDMTGSTFEFASGPQRCPTSDGFDMTVLGDDLIGRHILISGQFDRSVFKVLLDCAEPGDTLLDIGANVGYATCLFLASVPGSKVVAVEPQPDIADLFRINAEQFGDRTRLKLQANSTASGSGGDSVVMRAQPRQWSAQMRVNSRRAVSRSVSIFPARRVRSRFEASL